MGIVFFSLFLPHKNDVYEFRLAHYAGRPSFLKIEINQTAYEIL